MKTRLRVAADLITACGDRGPLPFIALEHLESHTGQLVADTEFPDRIAPEAGAAAVEPGDVLFGKLRPYLAKVWRADRPVYASTELLCIRPHADMDSRWLAYVCASRPLVEWAVASSDGTKMPRTSWEKLSEYRAEIPPLPQQRAIADYLDAETARIDALIEKKRRMVELLEERFVQCARQLTMNGAAAVPLRRVVQQVRTGTTPPASELDRFRDGEVPWYSPGDFGPWAALKEPSRWMSLKAIHEGWVPRFPARSTLIVGIGASAGRIAHLDHAATGNQQVTCLVPGPDLVPEYLSWQLFARTDELRATAPFTTLSILNNDFLKSVILRVPDRASQEVRTTRLSDLAAQSRRLVSGLNAQTVTLQERRQALITAAVTGELPIPGVTA